jgi:hypothetical protein
MKSNTSRVLNLMAMLSLLLVIFGCGGSDSGSSNGSSTTSTTSVSGTVYAGSVSGAVVIVKSAGVEVARSGASAADGSYTVSIPTSALSGNLVFETSAGTYTDEATGTPGITLGAFSAYAAGGSLAAGSNVTIDPSSTIIQKLVAGGKTKTQAEAVFVNAFGYTPDHSVKPVLADTISATDSQRLAGLRAAAFSKLTNVLGIPAAKQHELLQALADDLTDNVLDGNKTGNIPVTTASGTSIPADINNQFGTALIDFNNSLGANKLTADKIGNPPFAKTALTPTYKVEYITGMMAAAGKTNFKIKLTNLVGGTVATGKTITLTPKMYMSGMSHSSPVDPVVTDNGDGTYSCTVYYLMATMGGYWELKVNIGVGEDAIFYPSVSMSMGSTARSTLKGVADVIGSMMGMGTSPRTYYLFNDGSTFGMSSTFRLFIATADDSMMMNYPAVSIGSTLHDAMNVAWTVTSMSVEASTDNGATWSSMTDNGGGHWSVSGLTGLAAGGTVKVREIINSEQKTTDGLAVSGTNDSATFTIVAGM